MATKLGIYNGAISLLGETPIASLTEDRSVRYWLDRAWDNGLVNHCLEQGQWYFATKSQQITYSTTIVPAYGYPYAIAIPNDFLGMVSIWLDPYFTIPLQDYVIETGVIYTPFQTVYLKFISNANTYGNNLAKWPESFDRYVQAELALLTEPNITNSTAVYNKIEQTVIKRKATAKNNDKRDKPRQNLPLGNWTKARVGAGFFGDNYGGCGGGAPY